MGGTLSTAIENRYRAFRREYRKTLRLEHHLPGLEKPRSLFRRLGRACGTIARNLARRNAAIEPAKQSRCYSCETEFTFFRRGDNCGTCRMTHCGSCSRNRGLFKSPTCHTCVEMKEHGFDRFFRDKFSPLKKLSPRDVQPIDRNDAATFRGGRYHMMVSTDWVPIHRIVDSRSPAGGAFWTPTPPANVDGPMLSERIGLAILPRWNRMEDATYALLPPGVLVCGGFAAPQSDGRYSLLGGSLQIFVPRNVADVLFTGQGNDLFLLKRALELQEENFRDYARKIVDDWNNRVKNSADFLARDGKHAKKLPRAVRRALRNRELRNGQCARSSAGQIPTGTWLVHEEPDDLLGFTIEITVEVRLDKITTETSGRVRTTIYHYTILITVNARHSE